MFKVRVKIYSTDKKDWFKKHYRKIRSVVHTAKNVKVDALDCELVDPFDAIPLRTDSDGDIKPTWQWFVEQFSNRALADGYNVVVWHLTEQQKDHLGIDGINGSYRTDPDGIMEFYMVADEGKADRRSRAQGITDFLRRFLHELSHGFERWLHGKSLSYTYRGKTYNHTHYYDYVEHDIAAAYRKYDWDEWLNLQQRSLLLRALKELVRRLLSMQQQAVQYPIHPDWFINKVSQRFARPSSWYRSGIHNGLDLAVPVGTRCYAVVDDFEVYKVFRNHTTMGNAAYARCTIRGKRYWFRYLHLREVPKVGLYKRGEVFAHCGDTGKVTGAHLHLEAWVVPIDTKLLYNREDVLANLVDPFALFRELVDNVKV